MATCIFFCTFENGQWNNHLPETFLLVTVLSKSKVYSTHQPWSRAKSSLKLVRTTWEPSLFLIPFSFTQLMKKKASIALQLKRCIYNWDVRNESAGMWDRRRTGLEDQYMELKTVECRKYMMYILSCWQERHVNLWMFECRQSTLPWFRFSYIVIAQCTPSLQLGSPFLIFKELNFPKNIWFLDMANLLFKCNAIPFSLKL